MPSAVPAKLPKQASTTMSQSGDTPVALQSDAAPVIAAIENKIRNLEKRKTKLMRIEDDVKNGKEVTRDQKEAVSHMGEVEQQLEAMKELLKTANDGIKQQLKQKKHERKVEQKERIQSEIGRLRELLQVQDVLSTLGNDGVRNDFTNGLNGALKLSEFEINKLDELFRKICPSHEDLTAGQNWGTFLQDGALTAYSLLTNSTNSVPFYEGKTYRDLRGMMDNIIACSYFESKFGRSQSPDQAKSEVASTISNPDESTRVGGDKSEEHQPTAIGQQAAHVANLSTHNGGNGNAVVAGGVSPPRQLSPSALIAQGNRANISFLQEDQSGVGVNYGTNTVTFESSAINPTMPYPADAIAFVNSGVYNPASAALFAQHQSNQLGGYNLQITSNYGGTTEHLIPVKPLDPNAPTFVSQSESPMFATTVVSATAQMHQEPAVAQYYGQGQVAVEEQRLPQEAAVDENFGGGTNDCYAHQEGQERQFGGYRGGRGGYRGGERTGRGRYGGGSGYRGGREDGGNWGGRYDGGQGYGQGYRGRGGGYRGGYRNDDAGGQERRGRGGGSGYRGGGGRGGFEQRGRGGPRRGGGVEA